MKQCIYKFKVQPGENLLNRLPVGFKILSVAFQNNELYLWVIGAFGETEYEVHSVTIHVFATGQDLPNFISSCDYIGSAVSNRFVWHVFLAPLI